MKTTGEIKLECLRLATQLATSKQIGHSAVIPTAMEYYKWIDGLDEVDVYDLHALQEKFAKRHSLKD